MAFVKRFLKSQFLLVFQFGAVLGVKQGRKNQRNAVFTANSGDITPTVVSTLVVFNKLQQLFQVISRRGKVHHLVGLFDSYRVDLSQSHKLGECSPNRFNGRLSFAFHLSAKPASHPLIVPLILLNPDGDPDALFVALAQAAFRLDRN
jgi:hypothetical protein